MKKITNPTQSRNALRPTMIVLATAMALSAGAANAEGGITAFGQISLAVTKSSDESTKLATTGFGSGFGFRGIENLGNGVSVFFHIENRFDADTGATATPFWAEKSLVGLSGEFGRVQFGRFANPLDDMGGVSDPFGETVANMPYEQALGEKKWDNSVGYYTPTFGGFSAAFATATKEAPHIHTPFAMNVKYTTGPLVTAVAYVKNATNDVKTASVGANYDFGFAKLYGGYTRSTDTGAGDARNAQIGVNVPVSASGNLKAAFSNFKPNSDIDDRENKFGLGYWHNTSKRTMFFADVARTNIRTAGIKDNRNAFDVGIFHRF